MREVLYVVNLIVRPSGSGYQLLLGRRTAGRYMGGTWQLISGEIKRTETAWQAGLREIKEETGLVPLEYYRLETIVRFYRSDNDSLNEAIVFCAIVDENSVVIPNIEHPNYAWVSVAEAAAKMTWRVDREALREMVATILENASSKPYLRIDLTQHQGPPLH